KLVTGVQTCALPIWLLPDIAPDLLPALAVSTLVRASGVSLTARAGRRSGAMSGRSRLATASTEPGTRKAFCSVSTEAVPTPRLEIGRAACRGGGAGG